MADRKPTPEPLLLIQTFANTRDMDAPPADERARDQQQREQMRAWLQTKGAEVIAPDELDRALAFRDAVRCTLAGNDHQHVGLEHEPHNTKSVGTGELRPLDPSVHEAFNATAARTPLNVRMAANGYISLEPPQPGVDGVLGRVLAAIFETVADCSFKRLKICRDDACAWAYYDQSKNSSGNWCSMSPCGNRAKARTYRERQRAGRRSVSRRLTSEELNLLRSVCPATLGSVTGDPLDLDSPALRRLADEMSSQLLKRGITDGEINQYGLDLEDVITKLIGTAIDRDAPVDPYRPQPGA